MELEGAVGGRRCVSENLLSGEPDSKNVRLYRQNSSSMNEQDCVQLKLFLQGRHSLPTLNMEGSPAFEKFLEFLGKGSCEDIRPRFTSQD